MSHKTKYIVSIIIFVIATIWMLQVQGNIQGASMNGSITVGLIIQLIVSSIAMLGSLIAFVYFRSRKNDYERDREQELLERESLLRKIQRK